MQYEAPPFIVRKIIPVFGQKLGTRHAVRCLCAQQPVQMCNFVIQDMKTHLSAWYRQEDNLSAGGHMLKACLHGSIIFLNYFYDTAIPAATCMRTRQQMISTPFGVIPVVLFIHDPDNIRFEPSNRSTDSLFSGKTDMAFRCVDYSTARDLEEGNAKVIQRILVDYIPEKHF